MMIHTTRYMLFIVLLAVVGTNMYCADGGGAKKQEEKKGLVSRPHTSYRLHKQQGLRGELRLVSHENYMKRASNLGAARQALTSALEDNDQEAVGFYARCIGNVVPHLTDAIREGNVHHIVRLLPLLQNSSWPADESIGYDCSGLAVAVKAIADDAKLQRVMNTIIDFYTPNTACFGACLSLCQFECQKRRKAFLAYGLAMAGVKALENKRSAQVIHYIFNEKKACVLPETVKAVTKRNDRSLLQEFQRRYEQSCGGLHQRPSPTYSLLREFKCISDDGKAMPIQYLCQIGDPVMRGKDSGSIDLADPSVANWRLFRWLSPVPLCPAKLS